MKYTTALAQGTTNEHGVPGEGSGHAGGGVFTVLTLEPVK